MSFLIWLFYRHEPNVNESIFCRKNMFWRKKGKGQFEFFVLVPNFRFKILSYNRTIVRHRDKMVFASQKLISLTIKSSVDNLNPSCWYPISDSSCEFHIMIPGMSSVRPSAFKRRHVLVQQYKGLLLAFFKARAFAFLLWFLSAACPL